MDRNVVRKYRKSVPEKHRKSLDTRLQWLWHQRFGTVQSVYLESYDLLDRTAATMILQCILAEDIESISLLLYRLEGAPMVDTDLQEKEQQDQTMRI